LVVPRLRFTLRFFAVGGDVDSTHLVAKTANATDPKGEVNRRVPDSWKEKPEILAIQKAAGIRF
jgi:hypothetical protein